MALKPVCLWVRCREPISIILILFVGSCVFLIMHVVNLSATTTPDTTLASADAQGGKTLTLTLTLTLASVDSQARGCMGIGQAGLNGGSRKCAGRGQSDEPRRVERCHRLRFRWIIHDFVVARRSQHVSNDAGLPSRQSSACGQRRTTSAPDRKRIRDGCELVQ